jgi:hypothetical protein
MEGIICRDGNVASSGWVWQKPAHGHTRDTQPDPPMATPVGEKSYPHPCPPGFEWVSVTSGFSKETQLLQYLSNQYAFIHNHNSTGIIIIH